jgi:hypothetical protein
MLEEKVYLVGNVLSELHYKLTSIVVPLRTLATSPEEVIGWRDWTNDELLQYIQDALILLDDYHAEQILSMYPIGDPEYWGFDKYVGITVQTQRIANLVGEALVQCNVRGISTAYSNNTFNYYFDRVDGNYILYFPIHYLIFHRHLPKQHNPPPRPPWR